MEPLAASPNPFGGMVIDPSALPADPRGFAARLDLSIARWTADGRNLVWLEAPLDRAALVPMAAARGFVYHHASDRYVMMLKPLQDGAFVPSYSTHYIGAGGVVIDQRNHILVVRERRGGVGAGSFKLPGGHLHHGEHLADAVTREVREETGIETQFHSLVCFRHQHGYRYGMSDIYFVCRLLPLTSRIAMQHEEIAECLWMPVDDYIQDETISAFNKEIVRAALYSKGLALKTLPTYRDPSQVEMFFP